MKVAIPMIRGGGHQWNGARRDDGEPAGGARGDGVAVCDDVGRQAS